MNNDLPTITSSSYVSTPFSGVLSGSDSNTFTIASDSYQAPKKRGVTATTYTVGGNRESMTELLEVMTPSVREEFIASQYDNETSIYMSKRIVRVFLADTDDNVPLTQSILHQTGEKLTDLNDQELYFEIPIQEVLKKHNELRATLLDKKASHRAGKDVFLEPVKIRDLRMTVVNITMF